MARESVYQMRNFVNTICKAGENLRMNESRRIYLDYQATTPVDPRVFDAMKPYFIEIFGNPASKSHKFGQEAREAVEEARTQVARLIGALPRDIVFTSGATEADNLAIKGVADAYRDKGNHIITVVTEHPAVLDASEYLSRNGYDITCLAVDEKGFINLGDLRESFRESTVLVSVMHANNEIGVIQPVDEIGMLCRDRGVLFHVDAAQSVGKIPVDVKKMNIDLMSISAHKIYGPKGIGALYINRQNSKVRLEPQIHGGGHERGLRSGTLPTPLIVGFGKASEICENEMDQEAVRIKHLKDCLVEGLLSQIEEAEINGDIERRIPGNINVSFKGIDAEVLIANIPHIAVSTGSACSSETQTPSHVIRALGHEYEDAYFAVRFGIGRYTTIEEIDTTTRDVVRAVRRLRELAGDVAIDSRRSIISVVL